MTSTTTKIRKPRAARMTGQAVKTQRDLASAAGVSLTTVYNALHRGSLVSERTREKIFDLIRSHDYLPNAVARSMVRQKTEVLGIIVPMLEVAYYAKLVSSIERVANAAGYHCIICQHLDDPHKEQREVMMMRQRRVDGLIVRNCGQAVDAGVFHRLAASETPLVMLSGREDGFDHCFVGGDDRRDAADAVEWLIAKGHRRIAHLAWYRTPGDFRQGPRYLGYCDAMEKHGIEYDPQLVEMCQTEYQSGRLELLNILRRTAGKPPTAVFAGNDHTAIGALAGLREAGLRVPEDCAVVGYGGYLDQSILPLTLTTVAENLEEMGRQACEMLIGKIERKPVRPGPVLVRGQLQIGQSA